MKLETTDDIRGHMYLTIMLGWADMVTNLLQLKISKKKSLSQFQGLVNAGAAWSQWSVCLSARPGAHGPGYYISLI